MDNLQNSRHVHLLLFTSMILECTVANQLSDNFLLEPFHSTVKQLHNTETALMISYVRLTNDRLRFEYFGTQQLLMMPITIIY